MQKLQHKNKLLKTISVKTYTLIKKITLLIKKVVFLLFVLKKTTVAISIDLKKVFIFAILKW